MKSLLLRAIKVYHSTRPARNWFTRVVFGTQGSCRFYPTCSDYAAQAIKKYGTRGLGLAFWRILRCNPWSRGGIDPVK